MTWFLGLLAVLEVVMAVRSFRLYASSRRRGQLYMGWMFSVAAIVFAVAAILRGR